MLCKGEPISERLNTVLHGSDTEALQEAGAHLGFLLQAWMSLSSGVGE